MGIADSSTKLALSKVLSSILEFTAIAYFARVISPDLLGSFFLFQSMTFFLSMFVDGGIRKSMERSLARGENRSDILANTFLIKVASYVLFTIGIYIIREAINNYVGGDVAFLLIVSFIAHDMMLTSKHILYGSHEVGKTAVIELIWRFTWFAGGIGLYFAGFGLYSMIYSLIIGFSIAMFVGMMRTSHSITTPTLAGVRNLFDFAAFDFFSSVGMFAYGWIDVLLLGFLVTNSDISGYEVAWKVSLFFAIFSRSISVSIFPTISKLESESKSEEISKIVSASLIPVSVIIIPAIAGATIYGDRILAILFGNQYSSSWVILVVLLLEKLFYSNFLILQHALRALGFQKISAKYTTLSMIMNGVFNIMLVQEFGVVGAAVATALSVFFNTFIHTRIVSSKIDFDFPVWDLIWSVISTVAMVILVLILNTIFQPLNIFSLLIVTFLGAVLYILIFVSHPWSRNSLLNSWYMLR